MVTCGAPARLTVKYRTLLIITGKIEERNTKN
jgi:hypothetical protein